jgi:tetratricopeptide (TPR) repeat protein
LKVNGVFVERAKLVAQISKDQAARAKVEDGASISVISSGSQSLQARNAIFMWFQLFIEVLLRMHHKSTDRKELIDICKKSYKGNHEEMKIIDEFEKNYKPENAIWWYTRASCFYRMMNKALRVQDFDMLFAFRFFITDIAKQIKSEYEKFIRTTDTRSNIQVYRGQVIGTDELELMKNSIGEFLSMNSFLSTSRNRSTALHFARSTPVSDGIQRIIFEIEIDPRLQTKAFANVTSISYFENEDEVLIMLGALFRIEKVIEDKKDRIWVVRVSLASEDDYHLKETFAHMKHMIGDDTDLHSLGKILHEMGEYEQSEKCYERMMHDLQVRTADCHVGIGKALHWQRKCEPALSHYEQAMKIRKEVFNPKHESVGEVYSYIGGLQWRVLKDCNEALISLNKASEIQESTLPSDSLALAHTYHNLASTYDMIEKYDLASEYYRKALKIGEAVLPPEHPLIAGTYNNLGCMHNDKGDYTEALKFYQKSLEIKRKTLPPTHPEIVRTEDNIRLVKGKIKK